MVEACAIFLSRKLYISNRSWLTEMLQLLLYVILVAVFILGGLLIVVCQLLSQPDEV